MSKCRNRHKAAAVASLNIARRARTVVQRQLRAEAGDPNTGFTLSAPVDAQLGAALAQRGVSVRDFKMARAAVARQKARGRG